MHRRLTTASTSTTVVVCPRWTIRVSPVKVRRLVFWLRFAHSCAGVNGGKRPGAVAPNGEDRDRGRGHAGNARGLPERARAHLREPLADFGRQAGHRAVVETIWDPARLEALEARHVVEHPADVARVFRSDLDLAGHHGSGPAGTARGRARRQRR